MKKEMPLTFDEYLGRYRLLQHVLERDERSLAMMEKEAYLSFTRRFSASEDPVLREYAQSRERLKARLARRSRLCERYAARLSRAISQIPFGELQEYARYHYLYGFTHEDFAEVSSYSVRTVYRIAGRAKKEMTRSLLSVSPRLKKIPPAKYRLTTSLPRKDYRLGSEHHSLVALTAHRKSTQYRSMLLPR